MKKTMTLLVSTCAAFGLFMATQASAHSYGYGYGYGDGYHRGHHCRIIPGHWRHGTWIPRQKICYRHHRSWR